jgi:hypothetical protein
MHGSGMLAVSVEAGEDALGDQETDGQSAYGRGDRSDD